jgi:hypothetical protein
VGAAFGVGVADRLAPCPLPPPACRGDRHWTGTTFGSDDRIAATAPISINVVAQLDQDTGKVLRQFGAGVLYLPHMLTVDRCARPGFLNGCGCCWRQVPGR